MGLCKVVERTTDPGCSILRYFVEKRNRKVTHALVRRYGNELPSGDDLHVHCVSNKLYREQREAPSAVAMPYLNLSGIIRLRKHCIGIVSSEQFRKAVAYINNDTTALLSDVQLWAQSGAGNATAENREVILQALDIVEARLARVRKSLLMSFSKIREVISRS